MVSPNFDGLGASGMTHRLQHRRGAKSSRGNAGIGDAPPHLLSPAEWRATQGLARGLRPVEIASLLGLSVHTIRTQLKRAMAKAGVHTQAALVAWRFSRGR